MNTTAVDKSLEIYTQAQQVHNLKHRALLVAQALEPLKDEESIKKIAEFEDTYLRGRFSVNSLGTKLSQAGYNKLINNIPLVEGKNAQIIGKRDAQGNIKSHQLKHYFFKYCGLGKKAFYPDDDSVMDEWAQRNDTTRIVDRAVDPDSELGEKWAINPHLYLEKTKALVTSSQIFQVCAGLIAASGRRPNEIFRGKFELVEGQTHQILFVSGFAKKRGQDVQPYQISTLVNADFWLGQIKKFQQSSEVKAIFKEAFALSQEEPGQNVVIDRLTNKKINKIVKAKFQDSQILNPRPNNHGQEDYTSCSDLRSAYLCLAVERDYPGSLNRKVIAAGKLTGHLATTGDKSLSDRDLNKLGYTIGYASYYVKDNLPIPLINIPMKKVTKKAKSNVGIFEEDLAQFNSWKEAWEMTQPEALAQIVRLAKERLAMGNLEVTKADFDQLKGEFEDYKLSTQEKLNQILDAINRLPEEVGEQRRNPASAKDALGSELRQGTGNTEQVKESAQVTSPPQPQPRGNVRDWASVSKEELFGWSDEFTKPARGKGAKEARITRVVQGIFEWNDQFSAGNHKEKKVVPNTQIIRGLSGANPLDIKSWMECYNSMVLDHAHKHGLVDGKGNLDVYHNKKYQPEPHKNPEVLKNFIA